MSFSSPESFGPSAPEYSLTVRYMVDATRFVPVMITIPDHTAAEEGGGGDPLPMTEAQLDALIQSVLDLFEGSSPFDPYDVQKTWTVSWYQTGSPS